MLLHVLRFRFKDEISEDVREKFLNQLRGVESSQLLVVGQLINAEPDGYTHVYSVGFDDLAAMEPYFDEPGHRQVVEKFAELIEKFHTIDFSDDMDPTLGDKMNARLAEWMSDDPALSDKLEDLTAAD